jgi:hypothetical protein
MNPIALLKLCGSELNGVDPEKFQAAIFLAERAAERRSESPILRYEFGITRGRVRSDELFRDLALLFVGGILQNLSQLGSQPKEDTESNVFRSALMKYLNEDRQVIEAAATRVFFRDERLGEPADKLRWFRALDGPVLKRASELEAEV